MSVERLPAIDHGRCKSCGQPVPRTSPEQRLRAPFEPRPRKGGRQASYGPAVRVVADYLEIHCQYSASYAQRVAKRLLTQALPVKQRKPRTR